MAIKKNEEQLRVAAEAAMEAYVREAGCMMPLKLKPIADYLDFVMADRDKLRKRAEAAEDVAGALYDALASSLTSLVFSDTIMEIYGKLSDEGEGAFNKLLKVKKGDI